MTIARNEIRFNKASGLGMLLGTSNNSSPTSGNVFEDFMVNHNIITYASNLTMSH